MNKFYGKILLTLALASCKPHTDFKETRDEVIKVHDVVMADHGKVVDHQLKLEEMMKSLATIKVKNPRIDTLKEKDSLIFVRDRLVVAEEAMNTWMHEFEPDVSGKSNEEAVSYFEAEKSKIQKVDTLFKRELKHADAYLSKFRK